jgi:Secretion system C-terminal sorting domain
MKKFFWLTSFVLFCCLACAAQQISTATDSAVALQQSQNNGSASLFVNFSAVVKESNKVWLQWNVDSVTQGDYFIVERATDGDHFETIGALRREGFSDHYELMDIAPPNGTDLYRIKYTGQDGHPVYSKAMPVSLSGAVDFKFYPNPADKLLIIRTEHVVDIQVIDAIGSIRLAKRLQPGIQVINISSLEKGVYMIRVADKECNRIVSNQLLKN